MSNPFQGLLKNIQKAGVDITKKAQKGGSLLAENLLQGGKGEELTSYLTKQFQGGARAGGSLFDMLKFISKGPGPILDEFSDVGGVAAEEGAGTDTGIDTETTEDKIRAAGRAQRLRLFKATGRQSLVKTSGQGVRGRTKETTRARAT